MQIAIPRNLDEVNRNETEQHKLVVSAIKAAVPKLDDDAAELAAFRMKAAGYRVQNITSQSKYGFAETDVGGWIVVDRSDERNVRKAWSSAKHRLPGYRFQGRSADGKFHFIRVQ